MKITPIDVNAMTREQLIGQLEGAEETINDIHTRLVDYGTCTNINEHERAATHLFRAKCYAHNYFNTKVVIS